MDNGTVGVIDAVCAYLTELADIAVEVTLPVGWQRESDSDILSQDFLKLDIGILAEEIKLVAKEPAQFLFDRHSMEEKDIFTEGGADRNRSCCLFWYHKCH